MNKQSKTMRLTLMGLFAAVLLLMAYTPLGYLNIGPLAITFNVIPVALAAITLGPVGGAAMGAVFGLTSFLQCIGVGGTSAMGAMLFVLFIDHIYFFAVFIDLCAKLGVCIGQTGLGGVGGSVLSVCLFGRAGSKDAADQYAQRHDQCNTLFQREHAPFGALHRNISYIIVFLCIKGKGYGCKSPNVYHLFIIFTELAKWIIMNTNGKGGGAYAPCG